MSNIDVRARTVGSIGLIGIALVFLSVTPQAAPRTRLDLTALLNRYASGQFNEAVTAVEQASTDDAMAMRLLWPTAGRKWIDAYASSRPRRLMFAAAFALETEQVNTERGKWWGGPFQKTRNGGFTVSGSRVLGWAIQCLIERGISDEADRRWWLAAIALGEGVRDPGFLYSPKYAPQAFQYTTGVIQVALERYPNDPRLKLARAMALASPFDVTTDGDPRSPAMNWSVSAQGSTLTTSQGERRSSISIRSNGAPTNAAAQLPRSLEINRARYASLDGVIAEFTALTNNPIVGVEARVRLGYLYWATGDDEHGRKELGAAVDAAKDPDSRYLANFLLGVAAWSTNDETAAAAAFTAALQALPKGQSAVLALAALESQRGQGAKAAELVGNAGTGANATDPWREFLYGHYSQWPALRVALRQALSK